MAWCKYYICSAIGGINGLNQVFVTFVLVDFAWVFFRADSIHSALSILKSMITVHNPWILFDGSLYNLGLSRANFGVMLFSIFILLAADYLKYKGIQVKAVLEKQELWFRWLFYVLAVDFVIIFGIWGNAYDAASFIYFQF